MQKMTVAVVVLYYFFAGWELIADTHRVCPGTEKEKGSPSQSTHYGNDYSYHRMEYGIDWVRTLLTHGMNDPMWFFSIKL